ncbi:MAG: hypothetical protein ACI9U2_003182 [Bradymonadia bacterium]|jgi:hypothetical protein
MTLPNHLAIHRLDPVDHPEQVHVDDAPPIGHRCVAHLGGDANAGVVDHQVDASMGTHAGLDRSGHGRAVCHIELDTGGVNPLCAKRLGDRVDLGIAIRQPEPRARPAQLLSQRPTDARCCPGDECNLAHAHLQ